MHVVFNDDNLVTNMHTRAVEAVTVKSDATNLKRNRGSCQIINDNRDNIEENEVQSQEVTNPNLNDKVRKNQVVTWTFDRNGTKRRRDEASILNLLQAPKVKSASPVGLPRPFSYDPMMKATTVDATPTTSSARNQQSPSSLLTIDRAGTLKLEDLVENPRRATERLREAMIYCDNKTKWTEYIAEDALPFIRNALHARSTELKLSRFNCTIWPDTDTPNVLSVREVCGVLCDVFRIWQFPSSNTL